MEGFAKERVCWSSWSRIAPRCNASQPKVQNKVNSCWFALLPPPDHIIFLVDYLSIWKFSFFFKSNDIFNNRSIFRKRELVDLINMCWNLIRMAVWSGSDMVYKIILPITFLRPIFVWFPCDLLECVWSLLQRGRLCCAMVAHIWTFKLTLTPSSRSLISYITQL